MVNITTDQDDAYHVIKVSGDIDASSSIFLDQAISDALDQNCNKIIIDCQELNYISSAGLGVFMSYIEEFKTRKVRLALFGLNDKVLNVFQILGLDQLLQIVETRDKAKILIDGV